MQHVPLGGDVLVGQEAIGLISFDVGLQDVRELVKVKLLGGVSSVDHFKERCLEVCIIILNLFEAI